VTCVCRNREFPKQGSRISVIRAVAARAFYPRLIRSRLQSLGGKITSAWGARIAFVSIIPERVSTGREVRIGLRRNAKTVDTQLTVWLSFLDSYLSLMVALVLGSELVS